jgi:SAM-dependent methyltransferase
MSGEPPRIFDRAAYRAHRKRAGGDIFLADEAAVHIAERLGAVNRKFENALDLGSRGPAPYIARAKHWTGPAIAVDEEALPYAPESFDLVVSVLSLHAVNDLPGALVQIRRALKPDGLFIAALFGGETLKELRTSFAAAEAEISGGISPRVAPFADVRELGGLLQRADFALPVADVERTVVRYLELDRLFSDLRALGETNALAGRRTGLLSRKLLAALAAEYAARFADADGKLRATFDIVYLTGWTPHESQQKPLRPGSAKARLADALGVREYPTGEKPKP